MLFRSFVDQHLRKGKPLAQVESVKRDGNRVTVSFRAEVPVAKAAVHFTTDTGEWKQRKWRTQELKAAQGKVQAELPQGRPLCYFITLTDDRKATVSMEHEVMEK